MGFHVEIEGDLLGDWLEVVDEIGYGLRECVIVGTTDGVTEAKTNHRYQDQSGELTGSIGARILPGDATHANGEIYALAKHASFMEDGTQPHLITVQRARWLAWEGDGGQGDWHYAKQVQHPGTAPRVFMVLGALKCEESATECLQGRVDAACKRMENR